MKSYYVSTTGHNTYVVLTAAELRQYVQEEVTKARQYFGTAVAHLIKGVNSPGALYYTITARRDKRSAFWCNITAHLA